MAEPAFGKWHPIETAPKEGWLLLYEPWGDEPSRFVGRHHIEEWQNEEGLGVTPTHWTPLPPPPASPGEGGEG